MPLTPEQKQAIETLAGIPKADHEEFANELRGTAKPLFQVVFDSGFSSAEGRYKPRADAAEKRAEEAEAKAPTGDALVLKGENKARWEVAAPLLPAKPDEIKAAVILTGDQLVKWQKAEPLDLDDLTTRAAKVDELEKSVARTQREKDISDGVKAERWDESVTPTVLALIPEDAVREWKPAKVRGDDGKDVDGRALFVTFPGEGQQSTRLGELPKTVDTFKGLRLTAETPSKGTQFPPEPIGGGRGGKGDGDHTKAIGGQMDYSGM